MNFTDEELRKMASKISEGELAHLEVSYKEDGCDVTFAGTFRNLIKIVTYVVAEILVQQEECCQGEDREECLREMMDIVGGIPEEIARRACLIKIKELANKVIKDFREDEEI